VIELKAWRLELEERLGRAALSGAELDKFKQNLKRELEGEKPDPHGFFLDKHPEGRVVRRKAK
jgi:hypothetical protein